MQARTDNPYTPPETPIGLPGESVTVRWQVAPAALSMLLGVILFLMNCIHLHDAMIPEIRRSFQSGNPYSVAHGMLCMVASCLFFGASACEILAAKYWMRSRFRVAVSLNVVGVPCMLGLGVFLMYFQF